MEKLRRNWSSWAGFLLSIIAFVSYFLFFYQFPVTRDVPWVNFLLFGLAAVFLTAGLQRAFAPSSSYRGKISGPILTALSLAVFGFFCFMVFVEFRHLPSSREAPQVGQKAPDFALSDINNKSVPLSELLSTPINAPSGAGHAPRGVLLVFYRGYW